MDRQNELARVCNSADRVAFIHYGGEIINVNRTENSVDLMLSIKNTVVLQKHVYGYVAKLQTELNRRHTDINTAIRCRSGTNGSFVIRIEVL